MRKPDPESIALILALTIGPAAAEDGNWHLLTQSYGGTVSLQHGLDERTCKFARDRALGRPATEDEVVAERKRLELAFPACPPDTAGEKEWKQWQADHLAANGCHYARGGVTAWSGGHSVSNGDIKTAECFQ